MQYTNNILPSNLLIYIGMFVIKMMRSLNFPTRVLKLTFLCVQCSVSYSTIVEKVVFNVMIVALFNRL